MILYLDRSRPAMIYPLDGSWLEHRLNIYRKMYNGGIGWQVLFLYGTLLCVAV